MERSFRLQLDGVFGIPGGFLNALRAEIKAAHFDGFGKIHSSIATFASGQADTIEFLQHQNNFFEFHMASLMDYGFDSTSNFIIDTRPDILKFIDL